jgi:hypothetical protein
MLMHAISSSLSLSLSIYIYTKLTENLGGDHSLQSLTLDDEFRKLDGEGVNEYFYFLGRVKCL